MKNFIYTNDANTINKLKKYGYPLFSVNGDIHIFVNTPEKKEHNIEFSDMKFITANKVNL